MSGSRTPRVSVCVPAYQAERYLERTMRSVLAQSYPNLEIVVLDNASTDATADILAKFSDPRLRVERNDVVLPLAENWNTLVEMAKGDLVKVVCADDLIHPEIVARQVECFVQDPALALVSVRRHMISEDGTVVAAARGLTRLTGRHTGKRAVRRVVRRGGNPIGEPACTLFRHEHFIAEQGFDASLMFPMDIDLWVRLLRHGDFYGLPAAMAAFRLGSSSLSAGLTGVQYADQQTMTDRISNDPHWELGRTSRLVGRAGNINARMRHRALFLASAWRNRRASDTRAAARRDLDWLA